MIYMLAKTNVHPVRANKNGDFLGQCSCSEKS